MLISSSIPFSAAARFLLLTWNTIAWKIEVSSLEVYIYRGWRWVWSLNPGFMLNGILRDNLGRRTHFLEYGNRGFNSRIFMYQNSVRILQSFWKNASRTKMPKYLLTSIIFFGVLILRSLLIHIVKNNNAFIWTFLYIKHQDLESKEGKGKRDSLDLKNYMYEGLTMYMIQVTKFFTKALLEKIRLVLVNVYFR